MAAENLRPNDSQLARMAEFRDEWTEIGLSTEPADRPRAETAIHDIYRTAGLEPPRRIVWCGSPLSLRLTQGITMGRLIPALKKPVAVQIHESAKRLARELTMELEATKPEVGELEWVWLTSPVNSRIRGMLWETLEQVEAAVKARVAKAAEEFILKPTSESVWHSVGLQISAALGGPAKDLIWGHHDAGWLALYSYYRVVCGLTGLTKSLDGHWELGKSAGWAQPCRDMCWVSERHNVLTRDAEGRLHNLTGPSVAYPDGWSLYAVHGVQVPQAWIEDRTALDPRTVLTWRNVEQRRIAIEILGWDRILQTLNTTTVDANSNPEIGTLLRCDLPDAPSQQFLRVKCGTGREFVLPVPSQMRTALEANAWTYGLKSEEYALEART